MCMLVHAEVASKLLARTLIDHIHTERKLGSGVTENCTNILMSGERGRREESQVSMENVFSTCMTVYSE